MLVTATRKLMMSEVGPTLFARDPYCQTEMFGNSLFYPKRTGFPIAHAVRQERAPSVHAGSKPPAPREAGRTTTVGRAGSLAFTDILPMSGSRDHAGGGR